MPTTGRGWGQRIHVVGASGAGKTTLASALARQIDGVHVELDAINHQAGWRALPPEVLRERVTALLDRADRWVVDGNYAAVRPVIRSRADTVVLIDLPRARVMRQLAGRTLRRLLTREELWNGNREELAAVLSRDPARNVLLWSWRSHEQVRADFLADAVDPATAHLRFIALRGRTAVQEAIDHGLPGR